MKKTIYDLGACRGKFKLLFINSDKVIAVEANPKL